MDEKTHKRGHKRGAGEGSIYRREDGLWIGSLMVGRRSDGHPDRRKVSGKTRAEVQRKLTLLRAGVEAGTIAEPGAGRITLAAFLDHWLETIRGAVRPRTWDRYHDIVRLHIVPALGHHRLPALRPDHIQRLCADKLAAGLSPRTVIKLRAVLRRALSRAERWGLVSRNVAALVDPPRAPRFEPRAITLNEATRLLDTAWAASDRLAPLWTLAVYSGCRQGELLGLHWADVDLDGGALMIRRTLVAAKEHLPVYGEPKTSRSRRTVALPSEAMETLRRWRTTQIEERLGLGPFYTDLGLVFTTEAGTPLPQRSVVRWFKQALHRAELPSEVRFHDLRHFAATLMLAAGVHPKVASERLGHSTIAITLDLYSHVVAGLDVDAADRMQRALRGAR